MSFTEPLVGTSNGHVHWSTQLTYRMCWPLLTRTKPHLAWLKTKKVRYDFTAEQLLNGDHITQAFVGTRIAMQPEFLQNVLKRPREIIGKHAIMLLGHSGHGKSSVCNNLRQHVSPMAKTGRFQAVTKGAHDYDLLIPTPTVNGHCEPTTKPSLKSNGLHEPRQAINGDGPEGIRGDFTRSATEALDLVMQGHDLADGEKNDAASAPTEPAWAMPPPDSIFLVDTEGWTVGKSAEILNCYRALLARRGISAGHTPHIIVLCVSAAQMRETQSDVPEMRKAFQGLEYHSTMVTVLPVVTFSDTLENEPELKDLVKNEAQGVAKGAFPDASILDPIFVSSIPPSAVSDEAGVRAGKGFEELRKAIDAAVQQCQMSRDFRQKWLFAMTEDLISEVKRYHEQFPKRENEWLLFECTLEAMTSAFNRAPAEKGWHFGSPPWAVVWQAANMPDIWSGDVCCSCQMVKNALDLLWNGKAAKCAAKS